MKKGYLIALGIIALLGFYSCSQYNGLIKTDEDVNKTWGDVQASYQRRADLIPSLVATVKKAAENEKDILTTVTNARAGIANLEKEAGEIKGAVDNAKTPADLDAIGNRINTAIKITMEAYPTIMSTAGFVGLQDQLEGTENRINTARADYNGAVRNYNVKTRSFPGNIFAGMFGFKVKEEFKAAEGSDKAPDVEKLFDK
ncbi:MAG: LemA family protein [Bacteroidota bacterium]